MNHLQNISQSFLMASKTGLPTFNFINELCEIDKEEIFRLKRDNEKKAFWINIYNAFTHSTLTNNTLLYNDKQAFFKNKFICIAGQHLSLDDIEHGILRRSKVKKSLGYLNRLFVNTFERKTRVSRVDYRIHFALNCGAKSCPPIAFYNPTSLEDQLNLATKSYLESEVKVDIIKNVVSLPPILQWFRYDFTRSIAYLDLLKKYSIIPAASKPDITFKKYDWSVDLNNFYR